MALITTFHSRKEEKKTTEYTPTKKKTKLDKFFSFCNVSIESVASENPFACFRETRLRACSRLRFGTKGKPISTLDDHTHLATYLILLSLIKAWIGAHTNGVLTPFIKGDYANLNEKQLATAKQVVNPSTG